MQIQPEQASAIEPTPLPAYRSLLLAVDSSDHANQAIEEAIAIGRLWNSKITGIHVFAAKLHDRRFRQMEGGLPEQFRQEQELERQREVHDDLITRGLTIISDSYLDQVERGCQQAELSFTRRTLEGKNYRELVREANNGDYDLLVMGALGLGAVRGSRLGSVCLRVARRCDTDLLVIKQPGRPLERGPILVAVDGSTRAWGGLLNALTLARKWETAVHVVAAFDPYYHYVAFNRIADVLSEEAGKVFRFQEQEKLHEEIIDSGLAKIYQGHLQVAQSLAEEYGMEITTELLDGKPHEAIERYLRTIDPSLLVMGKLGIHADDELDIGGNSEILLHNAPCAVLLSQREHQPKPDLLASVTTSWTAEAEQRMERVPSFVRNMARMAILRYAQERGHTVITERLVEEATAKLMPGHAEQAMAEIVAAHDEGKPRPGSGNSPMRWSEAAKRKLLEVEDLALRGNLSIRAEKKARRERSSQVEVRHIEPFLETSTPPFRKEPHWEAAALARLARVPEGFMRNAARRHIEACARKQGSATISLELAERGLAEARKAMERQMNSSGKHPEKRCPFTGRAGSGDKS